MRCPQHVPELLTRLLLRGVPGLETPGHRRSTHGPGLLLPDAADCRYRGWVKKRGGNVGEGGKQCVRNTTWLVLTLPIYSSVDGGVRRHLSNLVLQHDKKAGKR